MSGQKNCQNNRKDHKRHFCNFKTSFFTESQFSWGEDQSDIFLCSFSEKDLVHKLKKKLHRGLSVTNH